MIIMLIMLVLAIIIIGLLIKYHLSKKLLLDTFNNGNVIVFGKQRKGKDLVTQFFIKHNKDKTYFGNMDYGYNFTHVDIKELELGENTFESFINGDIKPIKKREEFEGHNFFISDLGIYLPAQYDHLLYKKYPSLPIFYALTGQLYNGHFHGNTQALDRPWKAIREQADSYIKVYKTIKIVPFVLITRFLVYDRYSTALQGIEPFKPHRHGLLKDKELTDNEKAKFKSMYGEIAGGFIVQRKDRIYYDTRYFHKVVFGKEITRSALTCRQGWSVPKLFNKIKTFFKKKKEGE